MTARAFEVIYGLNQRAVFSLGVPRNTPVDIQLVIFKPLQHFAHGLNANYRTRTNMIMPLNVIGYSVASPVQR